MRDVCYGDERIRLVSWVSRMCRGRIDYLPILDKTRVCFLSSSRLIRIFPLIWGFIYLCLLAWEYSRGLFKNPVWSDILCIWSGLAFHTRVVGLHVIMSLWVWVWFDIEFVCFGEVHTHAHTRARIYSALRLAHHVP